MVGNYALRSIDFLTLFDHQNLDFDDECYYFMEYPRGGIEANKSNPVVSFIMNFKKSVKRRGLFDWKYKGLAINEVATNIHRHMPTSLGGWNSFTLIPIPPSKRKDNPEYDDRMHQALSQVCLLDTFAHTSDLFDNIENLVPSHSAATRPSKDEIKANLTIDQGKFATLRNTVILFDDVLTTGAHFKACKEKLLALDPNLKVIGIFIARTIS